MKWFRPRTLVVALSLLPWALPVAAQTPVASPTSLTFSYLLNSGKYPSTQKVNVTLSTTTTQINVSTTSTPVGWLTVTPASGYSPFTLTVTVNPTSLSPGTYPGTITVSTGTLGTANYYKTDITVTFAVTNPPSSLIVTSPNYPASGSSLAFAYTSNGTWTAQELDISTSGDIIPFTVTTAVTSASKSSTGSWLRVYPNGGLPGQTTSGVAAAGSNVRVMVSLDQTTLDTLDVGSYSGTITIAAVNSANGSFTVPVTLTVTAGAPTLDSIFPSSMPAYPTTSTVKLIDPVITLYGDGFFPSSSHVFMTVNAGVPIPLVTTWLSRRVLQATIPQAYLTIAQSVPPYPVIWDITVVNGASATAPSSAGVTSVAVPFSVTDPTLPYIQMLVNSASYLPSAVQTGNVTNPAASPLSAVSPREIISIFGQNLGPSTVVSASPTNGVYGPTITGYNVSVTFTVDPNGAASQFSAPLIMISAAQINTIVPQGLANYTDGTPVWITVSNNGATDTFKSAVVVKQDPGIFTFGGNGQGQAAVLNYDSTTGTVTVNGSKSTAARNSAIEIFATGLGDLAVDPTQIVDGAVIATATKLGDDTYRVTIGNQSAVVFYAGNAGSSVAGLVQINAIVPPNAATGTAVPLVVCIGQAGAARCSPTGVTMAIK